MFSTARRQAGVRVIGAGSVNQDDWGLALHKDGRISLHAVSELVGKGSIPVEGELIDFITFQASILPADLN